MEELSMSSPMDRQRRTNPESNIQDFGGDSVNAIRHERRMQLCASFVARAFGGIVLAEESPS